MKIQVQSKEVIKSAVIDLKIELTSEAELNWLETDLQDLLRSQLINRGSEALGHQVVSELLKKVRELRGL